MQGQLESIISSLWSEHTKIYPNSVHREAGCVVCLVKNAMEKFLVCVNQIENGAMFDDFKGVESRIQGKLVKVCPLISENAQKLRRWFPFTAPIPLGRKGMTIGLGDRLGVATPGHLRALKRAERVRPVLAQQSMRELTLTERTFRQVLDAATWAVFQEDYTNGFGADGDHLKTEGEISLALDAGYSMITLDCSEHLANYITDLPSGVVNAEYEKLPDPSKQYYERTYLNKNFGLGLNTITFSCDELKRIVLTYVKAITFISKVYKSCISSRQIDFEISIDETTVPTTPQAHYFVARELIEAKVAFASLAPRFCGEFQKGIDYKGDVEQFAAEFSLHAQIADEFGYRLSIHSGSDKFTIFSIVGTKTGGRVHVKTAGTSWLEAVRVIAQNKPELYRAMHTYALTNFSEALQYYHVTPNLANLPPLSTVEDSKLAGLLDMDDCRQLMHIAYGLLLTNRNNQGEYLFRSEIFRSLEENEEVYAGVLAKHIESHLQKLWPDH
ncbi:MAG: tagaturonate epimerase family protein [Peptococcaceae bacterium]|nr:tagaturonate epimerase family protein [Peptococcaceae bacterium]